MHVKSESSGCTICKKIEKFWYDLQMGKPYAFIIMTLVGFIILSSALAYDGYEKSSMITDKYDEILAQKPILRCGSEDEVKPTNYKVVLVDEEPIIKVFYSDVKVISYRLPECMVIKEVMNAELGVKNVKFVNSELIERNKVLVYELKTQKSQIALLESTNKLLQENNKQIKKDYNLPTYKELNAHYSKFKKSKRKDIHTYFEALELADKKLLSEARAEVHIASKSRYKQLEPTPCAKDDQDCLDLAFDPWQ